MPLKGILSCEVITFLTKIFHFWELNDLPAAAPPPREQKKNLSKMVNGAQKFLI